MTNQIKTLVSDATELEVAVQKLDDKANEFLGQNPGAYPIGSPVVVEHPAMYILMQQFGYFTPSSKEE